ncbi:MAG: hypothetical protein AN484_11700 [Aphanizomenon flos-aquae WA102]|uniref:Uncharacterized protein n=1 Tax=Aphanizomenon flos-aquae WA102 TaxID=1710896 RepID=A0A1B7X2J2_APHFL|nr:MAG: hypothetical protein AN484_11700 [Aphanizomenon flos-aquae WA102]
MITSNKKFKAKQLSTEKINTQETKPEVEAILHSSEWVKPEDKLPQPYEFVLVMIAECNIPIYCLYQCDDFYVVSVSLVRNNVNTRIKLLKKEVLVWRGNLGIKLPQ